MANQKIYNKKGFLHHESPRTCSVYHFKIDEGGVCKATINSCKGHIMLWNDLNNKEEVIEMLVKLKTLEDAIVGLREFIEENYLAV